MTFLPATGVGGLAGWRVLQQTAPVQQAAFERSPSLTSNIEYFRENIGNASSAEDLVKDRRLLSVALGAFGLIDEIGKKGLILRMLEGGIKDEEALANRFADPRYKALVAAFSYGDGDILNKIADEAFREDIIARYKTLEFERAVGEADNDMRLAMNFKREIVDIVNAGQPEATDRTLWFRIMSSRPLRELLSVALNVPAAAAKLDVGRQREIFADHAQRMLGDSSPRAMRDPEIVDEVIRRFFLNRQVASGPTSSTPGFAALSILQAGALGPVSATNLLLSQI